MSTTGQFNTKNPTIKRILKEASELANNASVDFHAAPVEDNLFEWHFTIRGPPDPSPYAKGIYHGRIVLPSAYPHRPPSFRFLTPSGRFEANREICLSISGFHEETWQPAWGIRTALVAIRSFMDTGAAGQLGGLECDAESRRKLAEQSRAWKCPGCGSSNEDILKEREQLAKELESQGQKKEETVPDELRLAYREDLGTSKAAPESSGEKKTTDTNNAVPAPAQPSQAQIDRPSIPNETTTTTNSGAPRAAAPPRTAPQPTRTSTGLAQRNQPTGNRNDGIPAWIDHAIYAVIAALAFFILRKAF